MAKTKSTTKRARAASDSGLAQAVTQAIASVNGILASLDRYGLAQLTTEDRAHSNGRLRDNEATALVSILDTVDAQSGLFAALAGKDHGTDPAVVETAPARAAIARVGTIKPLAELVQNLSSRLSDDLLAQGATAKDVTVPAYAIIQANAPLDAAVKKSAATAISFYKKASQHSATTRATAEAARTTKAAQLATQRAAKKAAAKA